MNITYNLHPRDEREAALSTQLKEPGLYVALDDMDIYVGSNYAGSMLAIARQTGSNVLVHSHEFELLEKPRKAPRWPWAFWVESLDPILAGSTTTKSSLTCGRATVHTGSDVAGDEFIALTLPGGDRDQHIVFRPQQRDYCGRACKVRVWPNWRSRALRTNSDFETSLDGRPMAPTGPVGVHAPIQVDHVVEPTGDPVMDVLLKQLAEKYPNERN